MRGDRKHKTLDNLTMLWDFSSETQAISLLVLNGAEIPIRTQYNVAPWAEKAKLLSSLVWQSELPFVKRVQQFSYQFPSEITLQQSVKAYIWNALQSFPREQHSKSLEFYLKAKCHIWTVTLQKLLCFIVRHQIFWECLWYSHWSCIDTPLGSRWWILR